jgi:hypothetical protein
MVNLLQPMRTIPEEELAVGDVIIFQTVPTVEDMARTNYPLVKEFCEYVYHKITLTFRPFSHPKARSAASQSPSPSLEVVSRRIESEAVGGGGFAVRSVRGCTGGGLSVGSQQEDVLRPDDVDAGPEARRLWHEASSLRSLAVRSLPRSS